ncbi:MAG: hypothetical protein PHV20_07050 [Bacteroidales bacterium]|nr:hypothetical protein [Bacteroidales bacterium]
MSFGVNGSCFNYDGVAPRDEKQGAVLILQEREMSFQFGQSIFVAAKCILQFEELKLPSRKCKPQDGDLKSQV